MGVDAEVKVAVDNSVRAALDPPAVERFDGKLQLLVTTPINGRTQQLIGKIFIKNKRFDYDGGF